MKRLCTEDNVQYALNNIANRKSVRKASLEWGLMELKVLYKGIICIDSCATTE